jgi:hypothetical protein
MRRRVRDVLEAALTFPVFGDAERMAWSSVVASVWAKPSFSTSLGEEAGASAL